ncbi:Inositol_polyphosphate 5-phosphatase [Hexamita inflata]|uniref:Inositol_polyphosphate 5-phosphatase n=1 Tax=Hexamita inflata TaxID=28002 RepID=A0ABP1GER6_9EUKA
MPSIKLITWNMKGDVPDSDISELFDRYYDFYVIGVQECENSILKSFFANSKKLWRQKVDVFISRQGPYSLVGESEQNAMLLQIFCKKSLVSQISCVHTQKITLGQYNLANKGAVSVSFCFSGVPFLFSNFHLFKAFEYYQTRVVEFQRYLLKFSREMCIHQQPNTHPLSRFKLAFLLGDFNMRVSCSREESDFKSFDQRRALDQMTNFQSIFNLRDISQIEFEPGYKMNLQGGYTQTCVPSWTDRILVADSNINNAIDDKLKILKHSYCPICQKYHKYKLAKNNSVEMDHLQGDVYVDTQNIQMEATSYKSPMIIGSDHQPVIGIVEIMGITKSLQLKMCSE